ncbi:coproporphyrinogen III oxidase [Clostridium sp. HCP1S3_B4]|uniref:coproporphyrinogen III oxidase n=1 Tax=unclassified Clostridium TaxID=2614128 RepID=UPI003F89F4F2
MDVNVQLNDFKYRYHVYHVFNIYNHLKKINFSETTGDYKINIFKDKVTFEYKDIFEEDYFNEYEKPKEVVKRLIFRELKKITKDEYPWGTLIGIRPSKIALKLLREGKNEKEIKDYFYKKHYTREDKVKICIDVAKFEEAHVNKDPRKISIYIGMAFCPTRCLYCSFASNPINSAFSKSMIKPYLQALKYEINAINEYINNNNLEIETVYFGGGTPTSVSEQDFSFVMNQIYKCFIKNRNVKEFTVECGRPDSITLNKLKTMKKCNVTRISINPQTMNDKTLKLIGRNHTSQDIIDKFKMARDLGFDDINMDIIIGLPGEGLEEAKITVSEIEKLSPDSITVHGLSLKRGSIMFENFILKKGLGLKSQEEIMQMYEESKKLSKDLNLHPYYMYRQKNMVGNMENLGYAKYGKESLYNIEMIEDKQTIIAIGADAVSKVVFLGEDRIERFGNVKDVREYVDRVEELTEGKIELLDTLYNK